MKFWLILFFCAGMVGAGVEKIALVIGNNIGLSDDPPLQYACNDAQAMYEILTTLGGVRSDRGYLLLNGSIRKVSDTFKEIAGRVKELKSQQRTVQIIVYYSGHGGADAFHLQGEKLPMDSVRALFDDVDADLRILIADACYSGALIDQKGAKGGVLTSPYSIKVTDELGVKGTVFITSSSPLEFSHESRELKGALFTYCLLSALRGAADYDHDDRISLWEAYSYAEANTQRQGSRFRDFNQNPEFDINISGSEGVTLTELTVAKSVLTFNACAPGAYEIFDDNSMRRVAGVYVNLHDSVKIALPRDFYLVRHVASDKVYIGKVDLSWGGTRIVDNRTLKPFPLDALTKKGGDIRFQPHALMAQATVMRGFPDASPVWIIPELAYQYSLYAATIGLQAGYTKDFVSGRYYTIARRIATGSAAGHYFFFNRTRLKLSAGAQVRLIVMDQTPIRPYEAEIRALGYAAVPKSRAVVWGAGIPIGARINLPIGFACSATLAPTIFLSNDRTGYLYQCVRFPLQIAAYWRF
jgi:hypothetical protein